MKNRIVTTLFSEVRNPTRRHKKEKPQNHTNMKTRMNLPIALLLLLGSLCAEVQGQAALTLYASKDLKDPIATINGPIPTDTPVSFKVNAALASLEVGEGYIPLLHNCDSTTVKNILVIDGPDRMPDVFEQCRKAGLAVDSASGICADVALGPPVEFRPFPEH